MTSRALNLILAIVLLGCGVEKKSDATKRGDAPAATAPAAAPATEPATSDDVPKIGAKMPAYAAVRLDGSQFDVAQQKGKVTLLNIWATWCTPCRYEIPELEAMHRELSPRGFEVVGVSIDDIDSIELVRSFVAEQKISYPIVLDPHGRLATMFRTVAIPMTILVDRDGTIVWLKYGVIRSRDASLRAALDSVL